LLDYLHPTPRDAVLGHEPASWAYDMGTRAVAAKQGPVYCGREARYGADFAPRPNTPRSAQGLSLRATPFPFAGAIICRHRGLMS